MICIHDLDKYGYSDRHGTYGGMAGSKDGILIDGEYWIVKYPQKTKSIDNDLVSYTTAPLSEFLGSHIYSILGYNVHETILGIRNNKFVVACKDFCKEEGSLREIRTLKNIYNETIEEELSVSMSRTGDRHGANLIELLLHLEHNPILANIPGVKERFWECAVVDIFINNNDRNNSNWGVLKEGSGYRLAPVFDNGASFFNKKDETQMVDSLSTEQDMKQEAMAVRTAYVLDDRPLFANKFLKLDYNDLKAAICKVVPAIRDHMPEVVQLINDIPEVYAGYEIMPATQKQYYLKALDANYKYLLKPAYEHTILYDNRIADKNTDTDIGMHEADMDI